MLSAVTSVVDELSVTFCLIQAAANATMTFFIDECNDGSLSCRIC